MCIYKICNYCDYLAAYSSILCSHFDGEYILNRLYNLQFPPYGWQLSVRAHGINQLNSRRSDAFVFRLCNRLDARETGQIILHISPRLYRCNVKRTQFIYLYKLFKTNCDIISMGSLEKTFARIRNQLPHFFFSCTTEVRRFSHLIDDDKKSWRTKTHRLGASIEYLCYRVCVRIVTVIGVAGACQVKYAFDYTLLSLSLKAF